MKSRTALQMTAAFAWGLLLVAGLALLGLPQTSAAQAPAAAALPRHAPALTLALPYLSTAHTADAPYGPTPAVDGQISPGEYAGAFRLTVPTYGGDLEVFFRQNAITLYLALDSQDTTPYPYVSVGGIGPALQVFLDADHDGGSRPQTDDYRLTLRKNGTMAESRGTGGDWLGAGNGQWTAAVYTTTTGWQAEFAIGLSKLGITHTGAVSVGLAVAEVWTPAWPQDWYWPAAGSYNNPSTWGHLVSSSQWGTFYWKPGPWQDYAPSGLPDFDQKQPEWQLEGPWTHSGPAAAANSLWWFDSKYETAAVAPTTIHDSYGLVQSYGGTWDDHSPQNVVPLVNDLAGYFGTNQGIQGTSVISMFHGMQTYLRDHDLWDDYTVTLVDHPDFDWVAKEVMRSEDVILLVGFWQQQPVTGLSPAAPLPWVRVGGHYVTVAGVDDLVRRIALSDPYLDAAEGGLAPGRVLSGTLQPHYPPHPGANPDVHRDAGNVSHDVYDAVPSESPGGSWMLAGYLTSPRREILGANPHPVTPTVEATPGSVFAEVEFALAVSPYTWKAGGYADYAPNGVPDFDQRQDTWQKVGAAQWTLCGPAAAANSLWWFDSKFEPSPVTPTTASDHYPLVRTYSSTLPPPWDDHAPPNVNNLVTPWPPGGELVEDLATRFNTDGLGSALAVVSLGTVVTDMHTGLVSYTTDHGLSHGYTITRVSAPTFWWTAEEVERSEDVILLLGFWQDQTPIGGPGWVRLGGHYVTLSGVGKQGGLVAFSDPWFNRMEETWPYAGTGSAPGWPLYTGRVANGTLTIPHTHAGGATDTIHNDAGNVSHDIYQVISATAGPGGLWGPDGYVTSWTHIENFLLQNQPPGGLPKVDPGLPIVTQVEWAVAMSPVADLGIAKAVSPAGVNFGRWITFTLAFSNAGALTAQGITVTDPLPAQVISPTWSAWVSNGGSVASAGGSPYTWTLPDLARSDRGVITVTGRITATDVRLVVTNTAGINSSTVEQGAATGLPNTARAPFTVTNARVSVEPAGLAVTVPQGVSVSRVMTIANTGQAALYFTVAEVPEVVWLSGAGGGGVFSPGFTLPFTLTVDATGQPSGIHTTTVQVSSNDPTRPLVSMPVTLTVPYHYIYLPLVLRAYP